MRLPTNLFAVDWLFVRHPHSQSRLRPTSFFLFLFGLPLERHDHAAACNEKIVGCQLDDDGSALWPRRTVGGTGIPRQREIVAAGHHEGRRPR